MKNLNRSMILGVVMVMGLAFAQEPGPIRVGGNVQQANLLTSVRPVYPPEAKQDRIQGTVRLEITIAKDGTVSTVAVVSGPPELVQSAVDAVKQWTYKPTLLNGEPVSVLSTVDVNYSLSQ
jgi:protein TonB